MISVIIATDRRSDALGECLFSLNQQSLLPQEVIIAHGGSDLETEEVVKVLSADDSYKIKLRYYHTGSLGAARQRNAGAEVAGGGIFVFLDDDVVCERDFIREIAQVFEKDKSGSIAGVSGTIVNQTYTPLSKLNKKLFDFCLAKEERSYSYAGKVVGPAVNFLPEDKPNIEQAVEWLPSCCSAFRREVFLENKFNQRFSGYSFLEDVDLSLRIGKAFKLINTTRARLYHKDLGGASHKDWVGIGRMQVLNRWSVMADVLEKKSPADKSRFFYYQAYCLVTEAGSLLRRPALKNTLLRWGGRLLGLWKIF
ncbi:MAG: glycosyltransferase [Candidatus Omnitrophota bacterium]|jgi:GT2 family glycosyltransferase